MAYGRGRTISLMNRPNVAASPYQKLLFVSLLGFSFSVAWYILRRSLEASCSFIVDPIG